MPSHTLFTAVLLFLNQVLAATETSAAPSSSGRPIVAAWFPDWTSTDLDTVRWSDYDELEFFVAVTTPDPSKLAFVGMDNEDEYIRRFTALARKKNVVPTLSVGGWTGSRYVRVWRSLSSASLCSDLVFFGCRVSGETDHLCTDAVCIRSCDPKSTPKGPFQLLCLS